MWQHNYTPIHGSLLLSSLVAALPIFVLLFLLGMRRTPAWIAALSGLGTTMLVSFFLYGMPVTRIVSAAAYGAAYGWFPIGWIVIWAVFLYRLTLDTGKFEAIKHSLRSLTRDPRLQTLLIAFAFGAFLEGAAGFGTPVAVAAAMLAGLGFSPFHAAAICLLANTAPVAFGSIAIPIVTLAGITGLAAPALERGRGTHLRAGFVDCAGLSGGGDGRLGRARSRFSRGAAVRRHVRRFAVRHLQFCRASTHRSDRFALRDGCSGGAVHVLEAEGREKYELSAAAKAAETVEHSTGQVFLAWSPYFLAGRLRPVVGLAAHAEAVELREHPDSLAGLAQSDCSHSAGDRQGVALSGHFQLELAVGLGNVLHDRLHSFVLRAASAAAKALKIFLSTMRQLTFSLITLGLRAGLGVLDELLGRHWNAGAGVRGHRRVVSIFQRDSRLAGRVS